MRSTSTGRKRLVVGAIATACMVTSVGVGPAASSTIRTSGDTVQMDISWTEYDPDDILRLPGNTHVGFLSYFEESFGAFMFGQVIDYDCDPGEVPGGGHGGAVSAAIVDEGGEALSDAIVDSVETIVQSGARTLDAEVLASSVASEVGPATTAAIDEEVPLCDLIGVRFLNATEPDGTGPTVQVVVDPKTKQATMTGYLVVTDGGHGEPSNVLARPPVNIKVEGGIKYREENSYSVRGPDFYFANSSKIDRYNEASVVEGRIGAMGFVDDPDDASFASYAKGRYTRVEKIRN